MDIKEKLLAAIKDDNPMITSKTVIKEIPLGVSRIQNLFGIIETRTESSGTRLV